MTDDDTKALILEMTRDRGFIVNAFSQVEYLLGRLIYEAKRLEPYADAKDPMPFGIDRRVAFVRRLVERPPLAAIRDALEPVLVRVLELEPVRHILVHGYCTAHITPHGDAGMMFERFVPPAKGAGGVPGYTTSFYRPPTLLEQRDSAVAFAAEAMEVFEIAFKALGVPGPREDLKLD